MALKHERTIFEALKELIPEVRENAVKNIINQSGGDALHLKTNMSVEHIIDTYITWSRSYEGHTYWQNVFKDIDSYKVFNNIDKTGINNFI